MIIKQKMKYDIENHKKKRAQGFSILIVPKSSAEVKRFEVKMSMVWWLSGVALGIFTLICVAAGSMLHYRNAYLMTEDVRAQSAAFVLEKSALQKRVAELEGDVARTERFAAKIESAIDLTGGDAAGKGPVNEEEWLPDPEHSVPSVSSFNLADGMWKSPFSKSLAADLNLKLDKLGKRNDLLEERVHSVFAGQQDKLYFWASLPSIWPTKGWLTSEFGAYRGWGGSGRLHEGVDIASTPGTPIVAPGDGVVTFVGYKGGYGQAIVVDHGYGISTLYGHCSATYAVEGKKVKRGELIAAVGNTGRSTGPHLHYEVHVDGVPVNPMYYVMNDR